MALRRAALGSLLVAVLACLLVAAGKASAAVWSSPQTISRAHTSIYQPASATTTTGADVASWLWQQGLGNGAKLGGAFASRAANSGDYGAERALPANAAAASPYAERRMVVATNTPTPRTARSTLKVRFGDLDGGFGAPQLIASDRRNLLTVKLAVNERGDSALAWAERPHRVYVSLRPHGGRFGAPLLVGSGAIRGISVAVGPAGDVLVAWDARGRVLTRFKAHTAHRFGSVDEVRSETTYHAALRTAIASNGRAWVAWTSQFLSEGGDIGDAYVQVARRPAGAKRFDRASLLDHGSDAQRPSPVSLAIDPAGEAVLAWSMAGGEPAGAGWTFTAVRAAKVSARGTAVVTQLDRFAGPYEEGSVSATYAPDASATAVWARPDDPAGVAKRVLASWSAAGGAWGAPEVVASSAQPAALLVADSRGDGAPTALLANRAADGWVMQALTRRP